MPQLMSTAALAGVSGWGGDQSGGGAIENTCSSLSACRRGVVGSETKIVHPVVARLAIAVTPRSTSLLVMLSGIVFFMAAEDIRNEPEAGNMRGMQRGTSRIWASSRLACLLACVVPLVPLVPLACGG